jgi:hypothetical protein
MQLSYLLDTTASFIFSIVRSLPVAASISVIEPRAD